MRNVSGYEKAVVELGRFHYSEFSTVRELHFYETEDERMVRHPMVELVVESANRIPNYRMKLRFGDVSRLHVASFGGGLTQVIGLAIKDISDKQWEALNWELLDYENSALALLARTAEIVSITPLS